MQELIKLYEDLADLTYSKCISKDRKCISKYGCCTEYYCKVAESYALEEYGIKLNHTHHPTLMFMSINGCTVPPYLRPLCVAEDCTLSGSGIDFKDKVYTDKYWEIRDNITQTHYELDKE